MIEPTIIKPTLESPQEFERTLTTLLESGVQSLVLDFSDVSHINSAGLHLILQAGKHLQAIHGTFALAGLKPDILSIFQMSGFHHIFNIYPDAEAAIAALAS
jgi:anti-sigma B factor antagonist